MCYVDSSHLAVKLHFFPRSHTILLHHSSSLHSTPQYDSWSRDRGEPSTTSGYTGSCPPLAVPCDSYGDAYYEGEIYPPLGHTERTYVYTCVHYCVHACTLFSPRY